MVYWCILAVNCVYCRQYGDPRLLEVTEERNGPSGLRDDDDDDDTISGKNVAGGVKLQQGYRCRRLQFVAI